MLRPNVRRLKPPDLASTLKGEQQSPTVWITRQVLAGDLGTIVEIYTEPQLAYDVECVNADGSTRALVTLAPEQVRRLAPADVLTTRQMPLAA